MHLIGPQSLHRKFCKKCLASNINSTKDLEIYTIWRQHSQIDLVPSVTSGIREYSIDRVINATVMWATKQNMVADGDEVRGLYSSLSILGSSRLLLLALLFILILSLLILITLLYKQYQRSVVSVLASFLMVLEL